MTQKEVLTRLINHLILLQMQDQTKVHKEEAVMMRRYEEAINLRDKENEIARQLLSISQLAELRHELNKSE